MSQPRSRANRDRGADSKGPPRGRSANGAVGTIARRFGDRARSCAEREIDGGGFRTVAARRKSELGGMIQSRLCASVLRRIQASAHLR